MTNVPKEAMTSANTGREMPKYKCHKEVWALKIKEIILSEMVGGGAKIVPEDEGYAPLEVTRMFLLQHNPKPGGYYVVYKDGYASYSPAAAFEEGYAKI